MTVGLATVKAQQRPLYSQYMLNKYVMNPAYTGTVDHFEASTNFRYQWVGLTDAPRTYMLTVHGPSNSQNYGVGGGLYNDVTGPTSKSGIYLSYAYHLKLSEEQRLSMGLSGGVMQYRVDGTKLTVFDYGDQVLTNQRLTALVPDFGFGLYWYKPNKFYLGISTPQFIQSEISFDDTEAQSLSNLAIHYFLNGGYIFSLGDNFGIEPSFMVKYAHPVNPQFDLGARLIFKNIVWLGGVYRTEDAASAVLGITTPDQRFSFGYSYDFTMTNLGNYSFGTHEIMVTAHFGRKKGYQSKGKEKKSEFERLKEEYEQYQLLEFEKEQKEKEEQERRRAAEIELNDLKRKDKALRDKIRGLREEAVSQGYPDAKNQNFTKHKLYIQTLEEIKQLYERKKELESILNQ